jgi:dipeptidyl-peptidase-4
VERQWWADAGFAVITVDSRGTPGVAPSFEKVVHRRLADVLLTDQVDALAALAGKHSDLDLARVAVRGGGSTGGWLAALAVLRRPDLFSCGVARTPISDWTLLETAFAERFLGLPDDDDSGRSRSPAGPAHPAGGLAGLTGARRPTGLTGARRPANSGGEVYAHHSLVELAAEPPSGPAEARPLLLAHSLTDPDVLAAHTVRLSAGLLSAGRPHAVLPLSGALDGYSGERQLSLELDFIRRHLP